MNSKEKLTEDLKNIGINPGDTILMHSSYKSLGQVDGGAKTFFDAFLELLGEEGTLCLPALTYSYVTKDSPVFDIDETPSCVGYLTEYFRTNVKGVLRSMHPTHSCCAIGKYAVELTKDHYKDITPVGKNSPFAKLPILGGKILMLGCGTNCNTSMHGVEETIAADYCLNPNHTVEYTLKNNDKIIYQKALRHYFRNNKGEVVEQCYFRLPELLDKTKVNFAMIHGAHSCLMDAGAVWQVARKKMQEDPHYFVNYES